MLGVSIKNIFPIHFIPYYPIKLQIFIFLPSKKRFGCSKKKRERKQEREDKCPKRYEPPKFSPKVFIVQKKYAFFIKE
jgi:hypothetical protein